jgi:WD40 repeat protein/tetratricopeptide (TPR) repeat protein
VAYSRDGTFFLTGSEDHTARLWDAVTGEPRSPSLRHGGRVHAVAICPDGKTFLTGSGDGTAQEWRSATGEKKGPALEHKGAVLAVAYSPDGGTILTGSEDGTARLWHAATGQLLGEALTHEGPVQTVAFSSDGTKVLTGSADRTARLWDVSSARPISSPLAHPGPVRHVLFSPDERMILSACDDHEIRRWNLDNGQPLDPPLVHEGPILAVAFSPDGQRILTTSEDKTARLWDAVTGLPVGSPLRHPNSVFAGVFSPDGKTVLTGSLDSAARLWDAVTGEPIGAPLGGHLYAVDLVAYGPDGGSILTASQDGTVRLWDAAELPDDLETLRVWVSAETGLELDEQGSIRVLEAPAWRERGARLSQLGDLRESRGDRFLDPILFGQDPASRARALAARGSEQDAEAAFDETVAMRPRHHLTFIERGRFHAAAGRTEKAAEDFSQGLALIAENRFWDSPRSRIIKELAPWEEAFDHLLRLEPEDDHLWIVRGRHRVLLSRFYQAAEDFARGIDSSPPESEEWFEHAGLCWLTGDYDGFRRFVLDMSEKGGTAPEPIVAYVMARSCNVSPEQVIDPAQVIRWADLAVNAERSAWYLHALGGAYYRAGQFAKAIEVLEESTASGWDEEGKAQNRLLLAMACLKTGDRPKARALVHEVDRWWATVETNRKGGAVALSAAGWIALNVLRREVEAILADGVFPSDPFAH